MLAAPRTVVALASLLLAAGCMAPGEPPVDAEARTRIEALSKRVATLEAKSRTDEAVLAQLREAVDRLGKGGGAATEAARPSPAPASGDAAATSAASGDGAARPAAEGTAPAADAAAGAPLHPAPWTEKERAYAAQLIKQLSGKKPMAGPPKDELVGGRLPTTRFLSSKGGAVDLASFHGKKRVLLLVMRGFSGSVCLYCTSQAVAVAQRIADFRAKETEVIVVYPGEARSVPAFLEAIRNLQEGFEPPFEVVLDVDLAFVKEMMIEGELAKPTSVILDREGVVRYAYVGKNPADRPGAETLLEELGKTK